MTAPIRVLIVSHRADRTGTPRCVLDLVRGLDPAHHACEVVVAEPGPLCAALETAGARVHRGEKETWRGARGLLRALALIRERKPDVVHVHRAVALSKTFALAARLRRRPLLWHLHDEFHERKLRRRLAWVRRLSTRIVACAQAVADAVGSPRCVVVHNGASLDVAPRAEQIEAARRLGIEPSPFRFLFVGAVIRRKNVRLLAEAAARAFASRSDTDLLIVGDGEDPDYCDAVRAALAPLGPRARFLPAIDDVSPCYAASHVLVLPSQSEAFPLVILEAAAHGLPTLATAVGGVAEAIVDGETGWLHARDGVTVERLAEALTTIRDRGASAAAQLGASAHERCRRLFPIERFVADVARIYDELASRSSA